MRPNYIVRPSKHVERKIFIEVLQRLNALGYNVSEYEYVGFGCFYFEDFILFNRYLSIKKMTSVENDEEIEKRVSFNKPYKFIKLAQMNFCDYLANIKNDKKYFIWLDYEDSLDRDKLNCISSLINTLMNGSVLIVTVNAQKPNETAVKRREGIRQLQNELNPYCGKIKNKDYTVKMLPNLFFRTIDAQIKETLLGRPDDNFFQLFNYTYRDGATMLTFGGLIDSVQEIGRVERKLVGIPYINTNKDPLEISVPRLTIKEKIHIDRAMTKKSFIAKKLPFEIDQVEIDNYVKYAKFYPSFYEVIMH